MEKVEIYLKDFGLANNEVKLYLALLKLGPSTVLELSKTTGLNRTTSHVAIESLIHKGLASIIKKTSRRLIIAEPPEMLKTLIEREKIELKRKEGFLSEIIKEVNNNIDNVSESTKWDVKILEGKSKVWQMYSEALNSKEVYSFCNLNKYYELYPDTKEYYDTAFAENKSRIVMDILVDTPLARKVEKETVDRYYVKFLPERNFFNEFEFGDYMMFDDQVALLQFNGDNTSCILINSKLIYLSFVGLHRAMWELLT